MDSSTTLTDQMTTLTTVSKWSISSTSLKCAGWGIFSRRDFHANNAQWHLSLTFNGMDNICFHLTLISANKINSVAASLVFYVLNDNNKQYGRFTTNVKIFVVGKGLAFHTFIKREDVFNQNNRLLVDNKLKVALEIKSSYENLCNETSVSLEGLLNNKRFSDVKFIVEGKDLYGHKNILANKSPVFSAMFEHSMKENIENVVELNDFCYDTVLELFRFIYTGRIENMGNVAKELLVAADKYDLMDLKYMCSNFLYNSLSVDNVLELLNYAIDYNVEVLERQAIDFFLLNTKSMIDVPKLNDILNVPSDVLLKIIRGLMLKIN